MRRSHPQCKKLAVILFVVSLFSFYCEDACADGKLGFYVLRMEPYKEDAEDFSRTSWGGGIHVVAPLPNIDIFAGTLGFEFVEFMSETVRFRTSPTGPFAEQQTDQNYMRFYLGAQVGGHGRGFLRPHAGINLALMHYSISTDYVIPDDDPGDEDDTLRQTIREEGELTFGYDFTLGMDINIMNKVPLDIGVRYVKSFNLPQQLGEGSVKIHPEYFQIYAGIGISLGFLQKLNSDEDRDSGQDDDWYEDS